jgi:hypothetical protein
MKESIPPVQVESIQKCAMACTVALCSLSMSAQKLSPQVLSDTQVMLRVPTSSKYLLLPVEESTEQRPHTCDL